MKQLCFGGAKSFCIILPLLLLFCSFCATAASAAPLRVFVSIGPEKWLVDQVGGTLVNCGVLVGQGREPHDFEPTPKQVTDLFKARVYFAVGMEFERRIIERLGRAETGVWIVDVTTGIKRIPMAGTRGHTGQSGLDPHVWLDPANLKIMAAAMARVLGQVDFAHAADYRRNLASLNSRLDDLDAQIRQVLAPCRGATFFVFHPAFGYFAHAYGLHQEAVETDGKAPTPRQLARLIAGAKEKQARVIFVQPQFDRKSVDAVARAIGGSVVPLDPLAPNVPANLRTMARKIHAALAGK